LSTENEPVATSSADTLPVRAVTLFTSGVSYTLREGQVPAGDASVTLTFRTAQINDILKSMVLLDEAGGVQAATYPSRDPVGRTLQSFAVDVTDNRSRADMLRQLRGAPVRVQTQGGETVEGRIVGVETRAEVLLTEQRTVTTETLTVLGDDGLAAVTLDRVRLIRLLDARLDREFREALVVLASGSDDNRRPVTLRFSGEQERSVRVGYVSEAPVWKVSYRLVLDDPEGTDGGNVAAKPYLQGWALVENTSDDDWSEVQLSLVSGRPVSFIQDLYQPLYIPRPVVAPDVNASPYPQTHGGTLEEQDLSNPFGEGTPVAAGGAVVNMKRSRAAAPAAASRPQLLEKFEKLESRDITSEARQSVRSQAQGQGAGELFEYHIGPPVTLPRQQAAMIPIVTEDVDGEKLSLYNPHNSDGRFPWNAVRLRNNTPLHLKGGPVTVFDGGVYAGDARIEDIPPGDSRLLTYAVDLTVEGERQESESQGETTLTIRRGVLSLTRSVRQHTEYMLKSRAKTARRVLIEHPFLAHLTLAEPTAPLERTANWYRFAVSLAPGETAGLNVVTEHPVSQTLALLNSDLNALVVHTNKKVPQAVREALNGVVERRHRIAGLDTAAHDRDRERTAIHEEQERIRANMTALDRDTPLYRRYLEELDQQETRLQSLRGEAERLRAEAQTLTNELRAYIDALEIGA
jgi:small nuclear ribonucleoprotein (snRNP)-like protein